MILTLSAFVKVPQNIISERTARQEPSPC